MANYITPNGSFETISSNVFEKPQSTFNPSLSVLGLKDLQNIAEQKDKDAKSEEESKKYSGRYIIIKDANLMKEGEQAYSSLVGLYKKTIVVKQLKVGDVVDIVKSGKGGIASPYYLSLKDGTYINAVDAIKEDLSQNSQTIQQSFYENHKKHLLIAGALVVAYFAYKKFKK